MFLLLYCLYHDQNHECWSKCSAPYQDSSVACRPKYLRFSNGLPCFLSDLSFLHLTLHLSVWRFLSVKIGLLASSLIVLNHPFLTDFMFILVQIWKGTIKLLPLWLGFACSCIHSFKADRDISLWYCYKISSHRTQLFSHMQNKMAASQEVKGYTLVDIVVPPLYHVLSVCKVCQCLHSQDGIMPWPRGVVQSKTTS